jgi:hypothetical protein
MRLFEKIVYKSELANLSIIGSDQFAYRKNHNSSMALVKCYHKWTQWLDKDADFVRVFSFDFSKAFDSVSHNILCNKLKLLSLNPYIVNWTINFLIGRQQRVIVDGVTAQFLPNNQGVPQVRVLHGTYLVFPMINDLKACS